MSLKKIVDNGKLKLARVNFGRESKKSLSVNFYAGCTYVHIRNSNNTKCISLGIDEYEEMVELLMDSLKQIDERFREEDAELNNDEDVALSQIDEKETDSEEEKEGPKLFMNDEAEEGKSSVRKRKVVYINSDSDDDERVVIMKKHVDGKNQKKKQSKILSAKAVNFEHPQDFDGKQTINSILSLGRSSSSKPKSVEYRDFLVKLTSTQLKSVYDLCELDDDEMCEIHPICFELIEQRKCYSKYIKLESIATQKLLRMYAYLNSSEIYHSLEIAGNYEFDTLRENFLHSAWFDTLNFISNCTDSVK